MQRVAAVAGLVLLGLAGVAYADSPGGWSQFDAMTKPQSQAKVAQVQQVQQTTPVYELVTGQKRDTTVSQGTPNNSATN